MGDEGLCVGVLKNPKKGKWSVKWVLYASGYSKEVAGDLKGWFSGTDMLYKIGYMGLLRTTLKSGYTMG